jgi:large subunit ribosomal protein L24
MSLSIKKEDKVRVIAGNDKGKTGRVLSVDQKNASVVVEGVHIVKKHIKPNKQHQKGGIIDMVKPIHISNVMLECRKCKQLTRISIRFLSDNTKVRVCKKCKEVIDN